MLLRLLATLFLPTLDAGLVDNGVLRGDEAAAAA